LSAISAWRNGAHGTLLAMPRGLHVIVAAGSSGASCRRLMKNSVTCKGSIPSCAALPCSGHAAEDCLKRGDHATAHQGTTRRIRETDCVAGVIGLEVRRETGKE
jgi:hypothetical protein